MATNLPNETSSQPFFETPKDWSKIKIRILKKYLQPFCYKLGSAFETLNYVDAFSGPGYYGDSNQTKGSPIVAAEWSTTFHQEQRQFRLNCIFVENDARTFSDLEKNLAPFKSSGHIHTYQGKFSENLTHVLKLIGKNPTLFLIDPFGVSDIDHPSLAPLVNRPGKTELLIRLDTQYILKMLGQKHALDSENEAVKRAAKTMLDRVSKILEMDEESWGTEIEQKIFQYWTPEKSVSEAKYRAIVSMYERSLKRRFKYVISTPIRGNYEDNPEYYLTFCSNHSDAIILMSDFMYKEEEALYKKYAADALPLFGEVAVLEWKTQRDQDRASAVPFLLDQIPAKDFSEISTIVGATLSFVGVPIEQAYWKRKILAMETSGMIEIEKVDPKYFIRWHVRRKG